MYGSTASAHPVECRIIIVTASIFRLRLHLVMFSFCPLSTSTMSRPAGLKAVTCHLLRCAWRSSSPCAYHHASPPCVRPHTVPAPYFGGPTPFFISPIPHFHPQPISSLHTRDRPNVIFQSGKPKVNVSSFIITCMLIRGLHTKYFTKVLEAKMTHNCK